MGIREKNTGDKKQKLVLEKVLREEFPNMTFTDCWHKPVAPHTQRGLITCSELRDVFRWLRDYGVAYRAFHHVAKDTVVASTGIYPINYAGQKKTI